MSAYTCVKTKIKRRDTLIKALQKMGFQSYMIEVSDTPLSLRGYSGDERSQKAHVRIKGAGWGAQNHVGNASNDLGWEQLDDGSFQFHVSEYDKRKYSQSWQDKLLNIYSVEAVKEIAEENGWEIESEEENEERAIELWATARF